MRDIVLINTNTTATMTERMVHHAAARLAGTVDVRGLTAPFGVPYVGDRASYAVASHAVVEMARELAATPPAAAVIACFGDPGLWAARAILPCPVVGMAEASLHAACQIGRKVGIVTGGAAWAAMLEEFVGLCGLSARLATIRTVALTGVQVAADPDAALGQLGEAALACTAAGADVVVLGGAGLIGLAPRISVGVPVIDSLDAALGQAVALSAMG